MFGTLWGGGIATGGEPYERVVRIALADWSSSGGGGVP
jgi:hypothetical protein